MCSQHLGLSYGIRLRIQNVAFDFDFLFLFLLLSAFSPAIFKARFCLPLLNICQQLASPFWFPSGFSLRCSFFSESPPVRYRRFYLQVFPSFGCFFFTGLHPYSIASLTEFPLNLFLVMTVFILLYCGENFRILQDSADQTLPVTEFSEIDNC
jgi:hypothetical protein